MGNHYGLYFPYFHFPNDEWVKLAALYWDKMYRIVPANYETKRDSETVKALADREILRNVHPRQDDLESVTKKFKKLITRHENELRRLYGVDKRFEWEDPYTKAYAPKGANPKLAYIYSEKIENKLYEILMESGLGTRRSDKGVDFDWVGMHPKLANVYMAALAEKMAKRRSLHPVAHNTENYFAVAGLTFERLSQVLLEEAKIASNVPTGQEVESKLAIIAIQAVMPKDIQNLSVAKILRVREEYSGELGHFQTFVQSVIGQIPELAKVADPEFQNYHLDDGYKKHIKHQFDKLEETMKSNGIDTVLATLSLAVPLVTVAIPINPILAAGATASFAVGLTKIIADKHKVNRDTLRQSDVAYLWHIREDLAPKDFVERLTSRAHKLISGV